MDYNYQTSIDGGRRLVFEQEFDLDQENIYQLFKKPTYLKRWWNSDGFELTVCDIDFQEKGFWHFCLRCMDKRKPEYGIRLWNKAIFTEIKEPDKIVYKNYFSDETGRISETIPPTEVTFQFISLGEKTKLISYSEFARADELQNAVDKGAIESMNEILDNLAHFIAEINNVE